MAQWIFLCELEKARHLYLDAYKESNGEASPVIERKYWDDIRWLDTKANELILQRMMNDSPGSTIWINEDESLD